MKKFSLLVFLFCLFGIGASTNIYALACPLNYTVVPPKDNGGNCIIPPGFSGWGCGQKGKDFEQFPLQATVLNFPGQGPGAVSCYYSNQPITVPFTNNTPRAVLGITHGYKPMNPAVFVPMNVLGIGTLPTCLATSGRCEIIKAN